MMTSPCRSTKWAGWSRQALVSFSAGPNIPIASAASQKYGRRSSETNAATRITVAAISDERAMRNTAPNRSGSPRAASA